MSKFDPNRIKDGWEKLCTNKQTDKHYENNGHLAVNQLKHKRRVIVCATIAMASIQQTSVSAGHIDRRPLDSLQREAHDEMHDAFRSMHSMHFAITKCSPDTNLLQRNYRMKILWSALLHRATIITTVIFTHKLLTFRQQLLPSSEWL